MWGCQKRTIIYAGPHDRHNPDTVPTVDDLGIEAVDHTPFRQLNCTATRTNPIPKPANQWQTGGGGSQKLDTMLKTPRGHLGKTGGFGRGGFKGVFGRPPRNKKATMGGGWVDMLATIQPKEQFPLWIVLPGSGWCGLIFGPKNCLHKKMLPIPHMPPPPPNTPPLWHHGVCGLGTDTYGLGQPPLAIMQLHKGEGIHTEGHTGEREYIN